MNHDPLHRLSEEDEDATEHDSVIPSHNEEHKRLGNDTDEEKGIVHNDPSYSQHPTSSNKMHRRQSMESARSYHSRVSSNRHRRSDKSYASITSNGSQRSRRSEMMRRKKNMSHLIKSTQGSGMILFEGNSENGDVKDSNSPAAQAKESKFYGWGECSDSAFSESGSEAQSAKDKIELYVAFPDGEELDASVTDSALSQQFEDVIMEDEYDSRRPWLKAPEVDQVSYESISRSSMYDGDSDIHVIGIAEDESRRTKVSTLSGIHSLVKSKSKNDKQINASPKVGTLISTKENGSENGKSNDDIISGSDISELLEAKAALRHAQFSLAGYSSSHSKSTNKNSAFSISSLKADKIMYSTPVYRRPEPFRPGPAFEKKFAQSNRNLSNVSLGSMGGPWSSRTLQSQSSSNRTMTKSDGSERDLKENSGNIILEVPESMGKEVYSPKSKDEGNFDEETPRTTPSGSGDSEGGSQSNPQVEVQSTPLPKQSSRGEISNRRRRSTVLEVVDEFEMEDEWDNYSAQSDEKEQQIKAQNPQTHNDLHLSRAEERNRMLELQEMYGSDTESESGQEIQEITPKRKPVLRRNSMESLVSAVSYVSNKCKHYTSACKRGYFRNKFALSIGILMAVVVVLGSLFVVFAVGKPGGDDASPTPSPTKNAGIDQYVFTKTKVPTSAPNSEGESTVIIYNPKPSSKPTQSPINVSSIPTLSEIPSLSPSLVGSNSNSSISISENVTSLTPSPSISPAPVIATEISTGYDTNSTSPSTNLSPTLSPTASKVASERADIIDISDGDNNDRTPSPTVFTMWPTVTDTYTKRFPPPPNRNSAYENQ